MGGNLSIDRKHLPKSGIPELDSKFKWGVINTHGVYECTHDFIVIDNTEHFKYPQLVLVREDGSAVAKVCRDGNGGTDFTNAVSNAITLRPCSGHYDITAGTIIDGYYISNESVLRRAVIAYSNLCRFKNGIPGRQAECDEWYRKVCELATKYGLTPPARIVLDAADEVEGILKY
jgi:hypothetical protein